MPNSSGGSSARTSRTCFGKTAPAAAGVPASYRRAGGNFAKSKNSRNVMCSRCYPCHTCLPQAQHTVSVGPCLVNCRLQIGQGLVITYVIILPLI